MTCAAAADVGLHVDATVYVFQLIFFSDVIMNEHLKLKTVNGDTVWGGVSSEEGSRPDAQNRQRLPILDPKIVSLN